MSYSRLITLNVIFIALIIKFWSILFTMIDTNYDISEVLDFHQQVSESLDKIRVYTH